MSQLLTQAKGVGSVRTFLDELPLGRPEDQGELKAERVHLMTIHASKGLEFPVVFIPGCEEGLLPLRLPGREPDIDEELRLLYVGMTRAREELILSWAGRRSLFGKRKETQQSPFLNYIEQRLTQLEQSRPRPKKPGKKNDQLTLFDQ